jgi:hypothetical protein
VSPAVCEVFTVEGNASNRIRRRSYSRGNSDIDGYCHPAYEMVEEDDMTKDELLDALESNRGQSILRDAVRHELRIATGKDDASEPAGAWFNGFCRRPGKSDSGCTKHRSTAVIHGQQGSVRVPSRDPGPDGGRSGIQRRASGQR